MPVNFQGAREIHKPEGMTDEQCGSLPIKQGFAINPTEIVPPHQLTGVTEDMLSPFTLVCYQPSKEDLEAMAAGRPIWVRFLSHSVYPMAVFTTDEKGEINQ